MGTEIDFSTKDSYQTGVITPSIISDDEEGNEERPLLHVSSTSQAETSGETSPDDILNHIGLGPFQVCAFLLSGLTYFAFGCDISIFVYIGDSVIGQWNITLAEYAVLPAVSAPPNVLGALFFSYLSDRYGRWWPYSLCMGWIGVSRIASAFANSYPLMIVLRGITSFAIGGIPGLAFPTLIEFLPIKSRGSVAVLSMLMQALGAGLSCGLAWWFIPRYPVNGWRMYVIASAIPAIVVSVFRLAFYVESPRYLIANGKIKRAWKVFNIIAKVNGKKLANFISYGKYSSMTSINGSHDEKQDMKQLSVFKQVLAIFNPCHLRLTLCLTVIMTTEILGYYCSSLFLPDFLKRAAAGGVGRYFTIMVLQLAQIPGILLLAIIVEWPKVGRLNSLRFFTLITVIFFLLLTFIQTPVTVSVFLIIIFFAAAPIQGLLFTYAAEVYPTSIRSVSISYFCIVQCLGSIGGSFVASEAANAPQSWVFPAVFAAVFFVQLCMSFVLNYEPGGKKLKDVVAQPVHINTCT